MKTFSINRNAIEEIHRRYALTIQHKESEASNYWKKKVNIPVLPIESLEKTIEETFWASLKREEDRHHNFSIRFVSSDSPYSTNKKYKPYIFHEPLEIGYLSKLAPALESTNFAFLVWSNEKNQPVIWGFNELDFSTLKIQTLSSGEILVSFSNYFAALVTGSKIEFIKKVDLFWDFFERTNSSNELDRAYLLKQVTKAIKNHSHGGTLLVVNKKNSWKKSIDLPIVFASQSNYQSMRSQLSKIYRERTKPLCTRSAEVVSGLKVR